MVICKPIASLFCPKNTIFCSTWATYDEKINEKCHRADAFESRRIGPAQYVVVFDNTFSTILNLHKCKEKMTPVINSFLEANQK